MNFKFGFMTHVGLKRQHNQDNGVACPETGLFLLADGMGGHSGGETASQIAIQTIPEFLKENIPTQEEWDPKEMLRNAIQAANAAIYQKSIEIPELQGMGTTATVLFFSHRLLIVGQVGDSRCYFFRPDCIWQLTKDHSLVQEKFRAGLITRAQMRTDKMKNVITRSVGFEPQLNIDLFEKKVNPGDVFLVCTDGLSGFVEDSLILEVVASHLFETGDIQSATEALIGLANQKGGEDNVTVILIQVLNNEF